MKSTAEEGHVFRKFGTGNLVTLNETPKKQGINVREAMLKFYSTEYSSKEMYLAVLGKESLDELQQLVIDKFSLIRRLEKSPKFFSLPWSECCKGVSICTSLSIYKFF